MRRSMTIVCLVVGLIALFGGVARAGDHHAGARLICTDCHIMHYSQSHSYNADGAGFFVPLGTAGPYSFLLRNEVNTLCLTCHDNSSLGPDVLGVNTGRRPGDIRQAGFLNRLALVGQPATGHTLDALNTAPGSNPPWKPEDQNGTGTGLTCINCHEPHGVAEGVPSGNAYRNLRTNPGPLAAPGGYITYAVGTNDLSKDVFERSFRRYDEAWLDFNEPNNTQSAMAKYCGGCHSNFHGAPGDPGTVGGTPSGPSFIDFDRHPTSGVNIGALGGDYSSLSTYSSKTNKVKVLSESGVWVPPASDVTPTCISCHKAHGNGNAFGLIYRSGTGTLNENGDTNGTSVKDLCNQCHVQG